MIFWFFVLPFVSLLFIGVYIYNRLIRLQNLLREAWSGIDVQLKRRHTLIPSLVEVVKGYASYEKSTLQEITELRSKSRALHSPADQGAVEEILAREVRGLMALAESYPALQANASFLKLQEDLTEIEDTLQFARRYYNGTVRNLNILVESFPSNILANFLSIPKAEFFQLEAEEERSVPRVELR